MQENPPKLPRLTITGLKVVVIGVIVAVAAFSGGYFAGRQGYKADVSKPGNVVISREIPPDKDIDFSLFWKVWDTLSSQYFDKTKLDPVKMTYGAIEGMVAAVGDPYTVFLPPSENKVIQEDLKGNFEGVGIQIGFKGSQLAVIAPLPGSPAEKAGIKAGDFIVGIKDENKKVERGTLGISLPEAVQIIRGPAGTKITLTLLRNGDDKPLVKEIVRETINVPSVTVSYVGDGETIAHIKLLKFGAETKDEWDKAVAEILKRPNIKGVIVDVRNNPGGYLQGAVDIGSEFIKSGQVVVIEEDADGSKSEFKSQRLGRFSNTPIVVLVNGGSASASEILAGALRDQRKIKLVGEKTFGKGTIQEPQQINGGAGLHITIARWLTPAGVWVNEKGLEPDVAVKDKDDTLEDEQLLEAIKLL